MKLKRLKKKDDIPQIIKGGLKYSLQFGKAYIIKSEGLYFGVAIPAKYVKLAVKRNYIKRILRAAAQEVFLHQVDNRIGYKIMYVYYSKKTFMYQNALKEMQKLAEKLIKQR